MSEKTALFLCVLCFVAVGYLLYLVPQELRRVYPFNNAQLSRSATGFDVRGMKVGDRYKMSLEVVYLGPPEEEKGAIFMPDNDDPLSSKEKKVK